MGRYKIKKKKDWKEKFRKPRAETPAGNSIYLNNPPPEEILKSEIDDVRTEPEFEHLSLHERNLTVIDAAINIFNLSKHTWNDIRRDISAEQIRELYEVVADVWHPKTNYENLLPNPSTDLRAIYLGEIDYLASNIFRFGLYSDEIFIIDPLHKPHTFQDRFNPLLHPEKFKADTIRILYFLLEIEPWVRAGMVTLIPAPGDFNFKLRDEAVESAKERMKSLELPIEELLEDSSASVADFNRFFLNLPRWELANRARERFPGLPPEMVEAICDALEKKRKDDPLALDQPMEESGRQVTTLRSGLNLETTLYLSDEIGAFPYTNLKTRWRELLSARKELPEVAELWSPLTRGFQELEFTFLNNVDSRFAYEMRNDGRLESFRAFLRRVWNTIEGEPALDKIETMVRDFRDELYDEYRKAQSEWKQIDTDSVKWFGATVSGALITGGLSITPPALPAFGTVAMGVFQLLESYRKRKQFKEKVPMSVFIDLSKRKVKS